jgi:hypothetical protein
MSTMTMKDPQGEGPTSLLDDRELGKSQNHEHVQ